MRLINRVFGVCVLVLAGVAQGAPVVFTPPQQEVINKLSGKGGLVMQLAADSDALVVNLSLGGKAITDAEVSEIKNLPKVTQLNLANTSVTDAGLAVLAGLPELTSLHLEKTGVTDGGLAHVKGLAKLEYLNLYGTGTTDAGLAHLGGLKSLKKLYLWQSKVTDGGVATLKKAVPAVIVNRGEELAIVIATPPAEVKPDPKKPVDPKKPADPKKPDPAKPDATKPAVPVKPDATKPVVPAKPATPDKKVDAPAVPAAAAVVVNTKCPVSGKDVVANFTAVYETKTVGMCCDKCLAAFSKDPAKFAGKIVADAAKK